MVELTRARSDREQEIALEDINDRIIQTYIATANGEIHDFDLEIRSTMDQKKKTRVFALVHIPNLLSSFFNY